MKCIYLGIDQGGKILMEVTYEVKQESIIGQLNEHIIKTEKTMNEIKNSFREYHEKQNKESNEVLKQLYEKLAQIISKHNNYEHENGK